MNLKDFGTLKKLMALTAADNDAEACASIRAANALLARNGLTWDMVFARTVKVIDEVEAFTPESADPELEAAFELALRGARGTFRGTLESIQLQWTTNGYITHKQRAVVMDAAERAS